MGVPQQHLQVALGLAPQLVGEEEAEGPGFRRHHGAHEAGALLLRLQAGVHVEVAVELWRRGARQVRGQRPEIKVKTQMASEVLTMCSCAVLVFLAQK